MGCGISTPDVRDASLNPRSNGRHHVIVTSIVDKKKDFENGDEAYVTMLHANNSNSKNKDDVVVMKSLDGNKAKDGGSNGERLKEKSVTEEKVCENGEEKVCENGGKEKHTNGDDKCAKNNVEKEHYDRDDSFIVGPGSPSFREYCNEYDSDSGDQSSMGDSNDYDSMESFKNDSCEDSWISENKSKKEENVNSNKEHEKKERRGRGFRNVINKARGRKKLLNFACYHASNESYAKGSFNKVATKAARGHAKSKTFSRITLN